MPDVGKIPRAAAGDVVGSGEVYWGQGFSGRPQDLSVQPCGLDELVTIMPDGGGAVREITHPRGGPMNHLYYGDNLSVLRDGIKDTSVDLIYLDPPFNSNASYNVLFKGPAGADSAAQIEAFDDTWHWN